MEEDVALFLIFILFRDFSGETEEIYGKRKTGYPVAGSIFESWASRIQGTATERLRAQK
jgi:hypothetical protein